MKSVASAPRASTVWPGLRVGLNCARASQMPADPVFPKRSAVTTIRSRATPSRDARMESMRPLARQDVVGRMTCSALRRCRAMQKQFKARMTYRGEIVPKLEKSETAARGIGAAIRYCQAGQAAAPQLAVKHVRESRAWTVVIGREDYRGCAVAHLDEIDELTRILCRPVRVKKHRACFGADDRDWPRSRAQQSLREH